MNTKTMKELIESQRIVRGEPASRMPGVKTEESATDGSPAWDDVVRVLNKHYHEPDIDAARVLYSAVAAHDLAGQPVWPMAVAPPGSMKTELMRALDGLPNVHSIDVITPKTFISGQIRDRDILSGPKKSSSLLHRIGDSGILLCPDFSTFLAIKADDRNAILADLRRIYDGELRKEFGTTEDVPAWHGRITLVAAVTDGIDKYHTVIQNLGDRFVRVRWARSGLEAAVRAMTQDMDAARTDLKNAVHQLCRSLPAGLDPVADRFLNRIAALAELAARARSYVPRGGPDKAIIGDPQAESATRLSQQLLQLVRGSARLAHRAIVIEEDIQVAQRSAFDCIPPRRKALLEQAARGERIKTRSSIDHYDQEDLETLGLLKDGRLSGLASDLFETIEPRRDFTGSSPHASDQSTTDDQLRETSSEGLAGGVL